MKIHAMTVCVNYADLLAKSIDRWLEGCESLTVVTLPHDRDTHELCWPRMDATKKLSVFSTTAFTRDGASFNKGRAMEQALGNVPWEDWILFFDADILPPADWLDQLRRMNLKPGKLYGSWRWQDRLNGQRIRDREYPGYFQLIHSSDPRAQDRPLFDTSFLHAGNYDTVFQNRWGDGGDGPHKERLPLRLVHLGSLGNWWGRGPDAMAKLGRMYAERRRRGGWQHERINPKG